jgi:hypothetical protein
VTRRDWHLYSAKVYLTACSTHRHDTAWTHNWWRVFNRAQLERRLASAVTTGHM